jgi:cell division protein FtsL
MVIHENGRLTMIIPADVSVDIEKHSKRFTKIEQMIIWITTAYIWIAGIILIYWIFLKIIKIR